MPRREEADGHSHRPEARKAGAAETPKKTKERNEAHAGRRAEKPLAAMLFICPPQLSGLFKKKARHLCQAANNWKRPAAQVVPILCGHFVNGLLVSALAAGVFH